MVLSFNISLAEDTIVMYANNKYVLGSILIFTLQGLDFVPRRGCGS